MIKNFFALIFKTIVITIVACITITAISVGMVFASGMVGTESSSETVVEHVTVTPLN